jgi:hypothetical protein
MNIMHLINPNLTLNASTVVLLLQSAAVLHLGLLWAGLSMPRAVGLGGHLAPLPSFIRNLFYVYYGFIGLTLIAFGLFTYFFAAPMAHGEPVARALCVFMTVFWLVRLAAALWLFDVRPYLRNGFLRAGYMGLNAVFIYLIVVYGYVAWRGGTP